MKTVLFTISLLCLFHSSFARKLSTAHHSSAVMKVDSCDLEVSLTIFDPSCYAICDGIGIATITGNNGPVTIIWNSGETGDTAVQLCVGANGIFIEDSSGCSLDTTFYIFTPAPPSINSTVTPVSCFGDCTGTIALSGQGGTGSDYLFSWNGGPYSSVDYFDSLCAGNYSVMVKDSVSCTGAVTIPVPQNNEIIIFVDAVIPAGSDVSSDGEIQVSVTGGLAPYTITANGGNLSGLAAGEYSVCVIDSLQCESCDSVSVGYITSIGGLTPHEFKIYPNPAGDFVRIEFIKNFTGTIFITDITGKIIFGEKVNDAGKLSCYTGNLERGAYLLRTSLIDRGVLFVKE